ncbi:cupredoxin domain-containing protein [Neorhodopirellula lusitana]|uniref:hypothetical protein n=1 Tax=Neorhodopirellula lusitana TaxID=445327 RepID=UPI00384D2677
MINYPIKSRCRRRHGWAFFLPLCVFALATFHSGQVSSAKTLDQAVDDATVNVLRYLEAKRHGSISVGDFTGPPQLSATGGPGIAKRFRDAFERHDIDVQRRSPVGLKGEFRLRKDGDRVVVEISASLVDPFGETLTDFTASGTAQEGPPDDLPPGLNETVSDTSEITQLVGATTKLHPEDSESDRQKDLADALLSPSFHLDGTVMRAEDGDDFGVEILVNGTPAALSNEQGHAFVEIKKDQTYAIRVINTAAFDAATFISIDGLSIFEFSELRNPDGRPLYRHYIIPSDPSGRTLAGWHKTNQKVEKFLVTKYADSAVAIRNTADDDESIGTITVRFHAAWDPAGPPPSDEDTTKGEVATGFGAAVKQTAKEVRRQVGALRSALSIRYVK